ncbi:MAG: hypothetical protein H8E59_00045 [Actinobacteria bacterium]|nr:hypothetical protein [Actinomycetota bacterium]
MSTIELPIATDEWERIVRVAKVTAWDDRHNPPVLQHPFPELGVDPQWRLRCIDGTLVEVRHDVPRMEPFAVALPTRLLIHAAALADLDGGCVLTIDDNRYATVRGTNGSSLVENLLPVPPGYELPNPWQPAATATLEADRLFHCLFPASIAPTGLGQEEPLPLELGISDGEIGFLADWSMAGGHRATFRTPATTDGSAHFGFWPVALTELVRGVTRGSESVTLAVFEKWLRVTAEDWTAWVPPTGLAFARWIPHATEILEEAGESVTPIADDAFSVMGSPAVRVAFHDVVDQQVLRISTVVATNAEDSLDVRRRLDGLVHSRPCLKNWFEEGRFVVAIDLDVSQIDQLPGTLRRFRSQLHGFDLLLSIGDSMPDLFTEAGLVE